MANGHEPSAEPRYIPALGYRALTRLYDPVLRLTMREQAFRHRLIADAGVGPGHRVLDVGCGTGTLLLLLAARVPEARLTGVDGDPDVLAIAQAKAARAGADLALARGSATALPYHDAAFDRVLSSLVFHHLTRDEKARAAGEAFRVVRPGGTLHVADWGAPHGWAGGRLMRAAFLTVQLLDGFATTGDNVHGRLPDVFRAAGFEDVRVTARFATVFGSLSVFAAGRPTDPSDRPGGACAPAGPRSGVAHRAADGAPGTDSRTH